MIFQFEWSKQPFRQYLLMAVVIMDSLVGGGGISFSATYLPQLQSSNSTIKLTTDEETYFVSALNLFVVPGTLLGCFLLEAVGRKWSYALVALFNAISNIILTISTENWHIFLSRITQGVTIGVSYPVCLCFVSEVASCKLRGVYFSIVNVGIACGMLIIDTLGTYCPWRVGSFTMAMFSLIYFAILLFLQNTHVWHLKRKDLRRAKDAYFWYKFPNDVNANDYNEQVVQVEAYGSTSWKQFFRAYRQRDFLIPMALMAWYYTMSGFSGGYAIAMYSVNIMKKVVSFDEYLTTILIDVIRVFAAILTTIVIKYQPIRRIINSCVVMCVISLLVFCGSMRWENDWIPLRWVTLFSLLFYIVVYNIGIVNMPVVCMGELFTGVTRPMGTSISVMLLFGVNFIETLIMPTMFLELGNIITFLVFTACIAIGGIELYYHMPETRNVTNIQIRDYFNKRS